MPVKKQRGLYLTVEIILVFFLMVTLTSVSMYIGMSTMNAYRADQIRTEAAAIDHALHMYSQAHSGINLDDATVDSNKNLKNVTTKPIYPASLAELGIIQAKFGYLSNLIEFTQNISADSPGKFTYTPKLDADGHYSSYTLKAYLPNGYLYQSPGSDK